MHYCIFINLWSYISLISGHVSGNEKQYLCTSVNFFFKNISLVYIVLHEHMYTWSYVNKSFVHSM